MSLCLLKFTEIYIVYYSFFYHQHFCNLQVVLSCIYIVLCFTTTTVCVFLYQLKINSLTDAKKPARCSSKTPHHIFSIIPSVEMLEASNVLSPLYQLHLTNSSSNSDQKKKFFWMQELGPCAAACEK